MRINNNTQLMQSLSKTKMNNPTDTKQVQTRSQRISSEISSMLLMLILAVLILPAVGLLPSAANGIRMQNLIHTR